MTPKGKSKTSVGKSRSYTVLKKSTVDPKKRLSTQGKTRTTTKTGAQLAAKVALSKRKRPSRVYLYRRKKIMTYSIKYVQKNGKVKAVAKLLRTRSAFSKTKKQKARAKGSEKKTRMKAATKAEIDRLEKRLSTLKRFSRRVA